MEDHSTLRYAIQKRRKLGSDNEKQRNKSLNSVKSQ